MRILQAHIRTERASRYLVQFCKHAAAMGGGGHTSRMHLHGPMVRSEVRVAAEWSETSGTVTFTPWGQCTLVADPGTVMLRIEAADEDGLVQIRDVVTRDFERFSRRDPMTVTWERPETSEADPFRPAGALTPTQQRGFPRSKLQSVLLALAVVVVIALHVGVAGTVVAESLWTGAAVTIVLALVVMKIALVAWARIGLRRRRSIKRADHS
ncbi:hypothetical protein GCM10009530_62160 [Microbispora corallina]|uniref:DUF2218 domain-containing protein n=1 Tax=Microbispora corallina TaxID=83302 RepID=A0ABQ4G816_9ACTN|nr:DUF2218 domain-containing protein [Microbispora corallina]GIH43143.1 hypothetical protein Mco01_61430 [Microbispora corallina]